MEKQIKEQIEKKIEFYLKSHTALMRCEDHSRTICDIVENELGNE